MGIALWLVPPSVAASQLKQLMHAPDRLQIGYAPPSFNPHITLASFPTTLASVESLRLVIEKTLASWNEASPKPRLHVAFTGLSASDHYFRSVLLDVDLTPELRALHKALQVTAGQVLGQAAGEIVAQSPRFPHLSLFYIPDEHAGDRVLIRDALWHTYGVDTDAQSEGGHVAFRLPGDVKEGGTGIVEDAGNFLDGFDAMEVWIAECEGPVQDWVVLERIPLHESILT